MELILRRELNQLIRRTRLAVEREEIYRAKVEPKLAALMDARLLAINAAWKAVLDVYRQVRALPDSEVVQQSFGFLSEVFSRPKRGAAVSPPTSPQ